MSRLLSLAGSPPLQALEARSYSAYAGCVSLATSTASTSFNLDQSDPPTCATTCGYEYPYVAIQAQFCFCFPSPPEIFTTYNDSDCSINCDLPYQDESCGGVTFGTLVDLYSIYTGSDIAQPATPSIYGGDRGGSSSLTAPGQALSPSKQAATTVGPTTTNKPSPATPRPAAQATNGAPSPAGPAGNGGGVYSQGNPGVPDVETSVVTPLGSEITVAILPSKGLSISPSGPGSAYTGSAGPTVYPDGSVDSTTLSVPTATTGIPDNAVSSSCSEILVTSTCGDDGGGCGSTATSVPPGPEHVVAYSPDVIEVKESIVEGTGDGGVTTEVFWAAVVPTGTVSAGFGAS